MRLRVRGFERFARCLYRQLRGLELKYARPLLGAMQERWLFDELRSSVRTGTSWRLLGQQVVFSQASLPGITRINTDGWDGYPSHRAELMGYLGTQGIRNVVATSNVRIHITYTNRAAPMAIRA